MIRQASNGCLLFFFEIFICGREHQLDTVQLIYLAGTRIVVDRNNVGFRVKPSKFFDNTFSDHMVWKAGKWLRTDDILCAGFDQLQHLAGQEPSLTGLIAKLNHFACHGCKMFNSGRRSKTLAFLICVHSRLPEPFDHLDTKICKPGGRLLHSQMGMLEVGVVEAVQQEVYKIRHNSLCALMLKEIHQVIICSREELDEDLSDYADTSAFSHP